MRKSARGGLGRNVKVRENNVKRGPKLIISDLDGTAVDMGSKYLDAERHAFQLEEAVLFVRERMQLGRGVKEVYEEVCVKFDVGKSCEEMIGDVRKYVRKVINGDDIVMPGLREMFADSRQNGAKVAIATNNTRENANMILHASDDPLIKYVNLVIAAGQRNIITNMETRPKPEADVFLACCDWFDIDTEDCLVLEDSISGIEAARNAQIPVFVYYNGHNSDILELGDAYITDYTKVNYSTISSLWNTFL